MKQCSLVVMELLPRKMGVVVFLILLLICPSIAQAIDGPLSPQESLKYLKTEPGLKVELVASEPLVVDPVAVAWDEKGRMFVVEDRGYPVGPGKGKPPLGQVVLLEDTNGDGRYDKRTVFADGLTFPNGVMPWNGGIYVTCAPYLYYFKDTNGDGVADIKQIVLKGFQDLSTTQLRVSHPTLNIDNWVYLTSGLTAAKVTAPQHPELPTVFLNRMDGRFRPGTDLLEETAGTAQFGQTFDAFGRKFICSNRNHIQQVVLGLPYLRRNPNSSFSRQVEDIPDHEAASRVYPLSANITTAASHTGFFTSACGVTIYQGNGLPPSYNGNSFTCEPAGNLVHHDVISPHGVTFVARRAYPTNEFLASPDNWFRPENLANGPDGALYVCDMYRKTIEHPEYLPEATRKITDFESGKTMGRIYRVVSANTRNKKLRKFDLSKASAKELCNQLSNPNVWWRMTAHRLLLERHDPKAIPLLNTVAARSLSPEARAQSLELLQAFAALTDAQLVITLGDSQAGVREIAIQLAEPRLTNSASLSSRLLALASDPDPRVRFQCALSLGALESNDTIPALVKIAAANLDDKWTRAAVLSSINHREEAFLHAFLPLAKSHSEALPAMMSELAHILAAAAPADRLADLLTQVLSMNGSHHRTNNTTVDWKMAAAGGFGDALKSRDLFNGQASSLMALAATVPPLKSELDELFAAASQVANDNKQTVPSRMAAIALLAQTDYATSGKILESLVHPAQPAEIQSAAVRALGHLSSPEAGAALVTRDRWNAYTPAVRDSVLSALMVNTNFLDSLFSAIEKGDVPAWTVNADRRTALMRHKDEAIKNRAIALFKNIQPSDRMKIYEEYKSVLSLKTDPRNGHAVFQKNCTACHVFAGEGKTVGPDLTGIRNQPAEVLLLHIIVPEYEIMPIYTCYNVETREGQGFTGLLAAETPDAITLRLAQGIEQRVPRSEIASMQTSRLSLMPQELEKAMSRQDLADLISFLKAE
jgi:putative membrane-bound dehydrogenase-like protein